MQEKILEFQNVSKSFPGVKALDNISFDIYKGEVHILVGENGAGKSTLIKLLCGVYPIDDGKIIYMGNEFTPKTPLDSINAGIRCVYQEFNLLEHMTIAENIYFQHFPQKHGLVDFAKMRNDTKLLLSEVGLPHLSPDTPVETLGIAQKQLVEIAKALSTQCHLLVLDEPTATLTPPEINSLFSIIKKLKEKQVTIIYISHRLQELKEIGDTITVLRNGNCIGSWNINELSINQIVSKMVGRDIDSNYPFISDHKVGNTLFEVKDLKIPTSPEGVSFSVKEGEIFGVSGLIGSGRTEVMRSIFGADQKLSGEILLDGKRITIKGPRDAVDSGICLLTEDRKNQGLILKMDSVTNVVLADMKEFNNKGLFKNKEASRATKGKIDELSIKVANYDQLVGNLSGGNQQKVVIAKWLMVKPKVFILDEPTRGIDVNAKHEIYMLLWKLVENGACVIFVSSDMPELIGVCHRIAVFSKGKITQIVDRKDFSQEYLLRFAYQEYLKK